MIIYSFDSLVRLFISHVPLYLAALLCLWKQDLNLEYLELARTQTQTHTQPLGEKCSVRVRWGQAQIILTDTSCRSVSSPLSCWLFPLFSPLDSCPRSHSRRRCPMDSIYHLSSALATLPISPPSIFLPCQPPSFSLPLLSCFWPIFVQFTLCDWV